ncbi:hypothetical protein [Formosa sp. L2A11]|uniref:hypothetical protein n=1 Tax=Formosa sp. L2A11 TaxID=2686363 RepID=UPI00131D30D3|nr:hypothetical protein [Formosa sp. L2A11]
MKKIVILLAILIPSFLFSQNQINNDYADVYIVIADTSNVYQDLKLEMRSIHKKTGLKIDMMDREYNPAKDLICLPEDAEDDMYAGSYFPRRDPSATLSIEYLGFYDPKFDKKTMGIITGLFSSQTEAEQQLVTIKKIENKAYVLKANIYVGCMH